MKQVDSNAAAGWLEQKPAVSLARSWISVDVDNLV